MTVHSETIVVTSRGTSPTYVDVTPGVKQAIANSGITAGICAVISPHTTCSVFFEEYVHDRFDDGTEFLQADLENVLGKVVPVQTELPPRGQYFYPGPEHFADVAAWPDAETYLPGGDKSQLLNADAHIKSTLLGSSEVFEVAAGELGVGPTGYIYFVDFDRSRSRQRKCKVVIIGE